MLTALVMFWSAAGQDPVHRLVLVKVALAKALPAVSEAISVAFWPTS
jgi:hypothetical protein